MLAQEYAHALLGAHNEDRVSGLLSVLRKRGHIKLLPSIARELERLLQDKNTKTPTLRVAKKETVERRKSEITAFLSKFPTAHQEFETIVDPTIVGGFVLENDEFQIDRSYRTQLIHLYRRLLSVRI